ncbi:MAG: UbiA prenyltransferase [Candidatus Saganbacteria bacterium]|uniref:UbiA prenyltransferase n=1 Tax=Candidatus Saganbacteria bacterium TaxID=2575572 RepID=A0A833P0I1_UNCSA|nr:MAG: UbiA prenyltransferase [Candidatus Saganbacteria bacterium]
MANNQIWLLFKSLRPKQWIKNLIIYAGLIFAKRLFVFSDFLIVSYAFLLFCLLTGCTYLINDLKDFEKDKLHPKKKFRPLAQGTLSNLFALVFIIIGLIAALFLSFILNYTFVLIVLIYLIMMLGYTFGLKEVVILDAFIIAAGYVLRGIAGMEVIGVEMSPWFLICASLIALFVVFCKRKNELLVLGKNAVSHRNILLEYNNSLLDQLISITSSSVVLTYSLYTLSPETIAKFQTRKLVYSVPFVLFGLFRYLYLVYRKDKGGNAEKLLLIDPFLVLVAIGWIATIILIIYGKGII